MRFSVSSILFQAFDQRKNLDNLFVGKAVHEIKFFLRSHLYTLLIG